MKALSSITATIVAIIILSGGCASAYAETWTLDSCIRYATEHNIDVRRQSLRVAEGENSATEAKDRFLPTASASASESISFGRGLTSDNTYADRNTTNTQWGINVTLPLFQGLAEYRRVEVARLSLQQYVYEREATKENLALNIISQYMQVLYCKEAAESARLQLELSEFQVARQKTLIESGKVAEATVYDFEATMARDRLQLVNAENDIRTALVNLSNMLQLEYSDDFDIYPLEEDIPELPLPDAVYSSALYTNSSLLGARQAIKVADKNIALAKTGYIPTLSLSGGIGSSFYTISGMPNSTFGDQMRHNFSSYIGVSLNIPIFDAFSTRNTIRRAKLQQNDARLALERTESDLCKEIRLAYVQARGAQKSYLTSGETLEKAKQSFEATRERYDLGRATIADYEMAKNNLYLTEITRLQARYQYLLRYRILEFYKTPQQAVSLSR